MADLTPTQNILLLQSLHHTPTRVAEVVGTLASEAQAWQPNSATWSCCQTLTHLAAAEAPFLHRLRRIVAEANPFLPYFGPNVAKPDPAQPAAEALAHFQSARATLFTFLSTLTPDEWERPAVHETLGPTTMARQVQNLINHDAEHLGQLYELRQAWENRVAT